MESVAAVRTFLPKATASFFGSLQLNKTNGRVDTVSSFPAEVLEIDCPPGDFPVVYVIRFLLGYKLVRKQRTHFTVKFEIAREQVKSRFGSENKDY